MDNIKLFPLGLGEDIRVEMSVELEGERYALVHVFREPDVEDRKVYWSYLGRSEMEAGTRQGADYLGAGERLYDRCALRAEGYAFPEENGRDWRTLVPLEHKSWAVQMLLARAGSLSGTEIKN